MLSVRILPAGQIVTEKDVHEHVISVAATRICTRMSNVTSTLDHVLTTSLSRSKNQERCEDGVKMKQFRISKFQLLPYYVPATSLLRPHHVLTTSFTFPLRSQYALAKFIPFPLRPCYVRPHKDQAVHTTRELRFQHVLTVNILISRVLRVR